MSSVYNGIPANVVFDSPLSVTSAPNSASPTTITVSGGLPADFTSGIRVNISGVQGNTAVNGIWTVTVTGGSTFTIPTAGSGAYTSGGSVQPYGYGSSTTIPSDGDARNAASVNVPLSTILDRAVFVAQSIGGVKLADRRLLAITVAGAGPVPWAFIASGPLTAGTPVQLTSDGAAWGVVLGSTTGIVAPTTVGVAPVFQIPVTAGDQVIARLDGSWVPASNMRLALYAAIAVPGAAAPVWPGGGYGQMSCGSSVGELTAGSQYVGFSVLGALSVAVNSGTLYIQPIIQPLQTIGSSSPQLVDSAALTVEFWRPTGVPQ